MYDELDNVRKPWSYHCKPLNLTPKQYKLLADMISREIKVVAQLGDIKRTAILCDIYDKIIKLL